MSNEELDATFNCSVDPNLSLTRVAICLSCYQKEQNTMMQAMVDPQYK
jgi:hypothetical protein